MKKDFNCQNMSEKEKHRLQKSGKFYIDETIMLETCTDEVTSIKIHFYNIHYFIGYGITKFIEAIEEEYDVKYHDYEINIKKRKLIFEFNKTWLLTKCRDI